jgi:hypothetical protein
MLRLTGYFGNVVRTSSGYDDEVSYTFIFLPRL